MKRDSGDLTLLIHRSMRAAGWDVDTLYTRLGYDIRELPWHECRPRHRLQIGFWETVEQFSDDRQAGLSLCRFVPPYRGRGLEYVLFASDTLRSGLQSLLPYRRLVSDALEIQLVEDERGARVRLRGTTYDAPVRRHPEACFVQAFVNILAAATDGAVSPRHIDLCIPRPSRIADYQQVFGCSIGFDTEMSEIWLPDGALDIELFHADPELRELHCQYADRRLADVARHDKMDEVFGYLLEQFEAGEIASEETHTLAQAAYDLGLSERRLRFELGEIDASFRDLFRRARLSYAKRLLESTADRVDDIATRLGFSETSTFSRAFRRYFGLTPSDYRSRSSHHGQRG